MENGAARRRKISKVGGGGGEENREEVGRSDAREFNPEKRTAFRQMS